MDYSQFYSGDASTMVDRAAAPPEPERQLPAPPPHHGDSLRPASLGGAERPLLEFAPEVGDTHINATVDSGTSCIIIPSSTGGVTSNSPSAAWQAVVSANPPSKAAPIVLTFIVDGREYPV